MKGSCNVVKISKCLPFSNRLVSRSNERIEWLHSAQE